MKKILAILLVIVMLLGLCACNKKEESNSGVDASGKPTISIGLGSNAKIISFEDNALTDWLEETCNCNIEIVEYSGGSDIATQVSTTIAARQELPDILWGVNINSSTISTYGKEGYFVDLKPYYENKEGSGKIFWDRMDECLTEYQREYVLSKMVDPDTGGMYGVPAIETSLVDGLDFMLWINTEWLDKLNLQKPTNTDELYEVLVAFRDQDPNGNGQKDEIPLFGSQKSTGPGQAINWLINMFIYFDDGHLWQDYNGDGQLEYVYREEAYREALKFVNKLYKEKLLTTMIYTASSSEMKTITTPASGTALCGIFCGHLTSHTTFQSPVLYQYECMKTWGCATDRDIAYNLDTFITETAEKRGVTQACFDLLMTMWTKDGALRIRYGEHGVNWVEPDEGAVSDYGLPAQYKMLDDPFMQQNTAMWGDIASTLNDYAEGETAQISDELDEWTAHKSKLHALARQYYEEVRDEINPKFLADPFMEAFILKSDEDEEISLIRTNVSNVVNTYTKDFITGSSGKDINNDSHWAEFLSEMDKEGYAELQAMYQKCYERQIAD